MSGQLVRFSRVLATAVAQTTVPEAASRASAVAIAEPAPTDRYGDARSESVVVAERCLCHVVSGVGGSQKPDWAIVSSETSLPPLNQAGTADKHSR